MQIDFLKVWLPPVNLWSRPRQSAFDYSGEADQANEYWYKKGYEQAIKDVKEKLEDLSKKRKPDKNDVGAW